MPTTIIPPNDPNSVSEASFIHTKAILFATFSLLVALLICPCLTWHFRNRNIGATVLVAAAIYSNFQNFLNAVIWPSDSPATWFNGVGLCDVEVKLQLFLQCVFPAAISCILRALAAVMDTERSTMAWGRTKAQRRRGYALDLVCCVGIPSLQMPIHYIVQPFRYYIFGITGCYASADTNWFMFVFLLGHPLLWTLVDVYYSGKNPRHTQTFPC
jgi:pheromone a factor receptor